MKVKIEVSRRMAEIAIGQHLVFCNGIGINSRTFSEIVREYIFMYGESSLDDHQQENEVNGVSEYAKLITKKYFK